jgi:hypothetical protein
MNKNPLVSALQDWSVDEHYALNLWRTIYIFFLEQYLMIKVMSVFENRISGIFIISIYEGLVFHAIVNFTAVDEYLSSLLFNYYLERFYVILLR